MQRRPFCFPLHRFQGWFCFHSESTGLVSYRQYFADSTAKDGLMSFRTVFLALAIVFHFTSAQNTNVGCGGYLENVAVGFETDAAGNLLQAGDTPRLLPGGIHKITATRRTRNGVARGKVMIFDTNNPTGGDFDLRRRWWGNVLIVSENGDGEDPPKANR